MSGGSLTAGVLGGMGPGATVDFMAKVIALTPADRDQDHVRMLVDNNPRVLQCLVRHLQHQPLLGIHRGRFFWVIP